MLLTGPAHWPYARAWLLALAAFAAACLSAVYAGEIANLHRAIEGRTDLSACRQDAPPGQLALPGSGGSGKHCEAQDATPELTTIGLERTGCYSGTCPIYTVIIDADGSFRYEGVANVARIGNFRGRVDRAALKHVLLFAEAIEVFDFNSSYLSPYLDQPSVYVLVQTQERRKVILDYGNGGPPELWALERLIDDLIEAATFDPAP